MNRHRAKGSDTWRSCALPPCRSLCTSWALKGASLRAWGPEPRLLVPGELSSFHVASPYSLSLLQIKSQDLFQIWVAQLRAHRLAQRLDMPRGPLPSTTHQKVRWVLGQEMWGFRGGGFREL